MIQLKDYKPSDYLIDQVDLIIDLQDNHATTVHSTLQCRRHPTLSNTIEAPLVLQGEKLSLQSIHIDGRALAASEYAVDDKTLTLFKVPQSFSLKTIVHIHPETNTELSGLYRSKNMFCTQCEAEGFRRITYYLDRPDVMARFTTIIHADKRAFPVLLSNGNLMEKFDLSADRHGVCWQDPFPKPCYLFALVAGDLVSMTDHFVTMNNRIVSLEIYTAFHDQDQCQHAMLALKKAMRWDEETYGREYDLDRYMIVAVSDFNMGAMENKGLNVFNAKYILANAQTATDADYDNIDAVVGHEYFHNWSGNRVTCRDWFQLSLKEGLTVFREHHFCGDLRQSAVQLIDQVCCLRDDQFSEDAGPMAHPVRPEAYAEINNFYTATIYEKGSEIIRMLKHFMGWETFRQGMDQYFSQYDGQAVTIEDFIATMEQVSKQDLSQFRLWYSQAGTPELRAQETYDVQNHRYTLTLTQHCAPTPGQDLKKPLLIPVAIGLLDTEGRDLLPIETRVTLTEEAQTFVFEAIPCKPVLSLLRSFSAPVKRGTKQSKEALAFLLAHDSDAFNRWDAGQQLSEGLIFRLLEDFEAKRALIIDPSWIAAHEAVLRDKTLDPALRAKILSLPTLNTLVEAQLPVNITALSAVRQFLKVQLASALKSDFFESYADNHCKGSYVFSPEACATRRLRDLSLSYLVQTNDTEALALCKQQFQHTRSMTDTMGVLNAVCDSTAPLRAMVLSEFYEKWRNHPLVLDKWFRIQAVSVLPDTVQTVKRLMQDVAFDLKNPNKVYALIGAFANANLMHFHDQSGAGYDLVLEVVLKLNALNPQVAARIVDAFAPWRRFDAARQQKMIKALQTIQAAPNLSTNVQEIVEKCLAT
ncbi:MAG: aminopeptidase N [Gammaproteobacteria bacterium]|nr:aminopeptidase N [Gammaproteobacteria bacterium]MBP9728811.1 aminopeptidase N [Gammaproteobacteria bacterium]